MGEPGFGLSNMAYFVSRRLAKSDTTAKEPRILEFLGKIETEVQLTDELIEAWSERLQRLQPLAAAPIEVRRLVEHAVLALRVPAEPDVELEAGETAVDADLDDLAIALRCLLENAAEASVGQAIQVRGKPAGGVYALTVGNAGPSLPEVASRGQPVESNKAGHLGVGLALARRTAQRYGGKLLIGSPASGVEITLQLPASKRDHGGYGGP
jgi:signal transduction histidine kinase